MVKYIFGPSSLSEIWN